MILQYKGLKDVWCYEYAETISFSNIYIGDIIDKYSRYYDNNIEKLKAIHNEIDILIKQETDACDEIIYYIDNIIDVKNICVVTLRDDNKYISRVFDKTAYLLNDKGQIVKKLI